MLRQIGKAVRLGCACRVGAPAAQARSLGYARALGAIRAKLATLKPGDRTYDDIVASRDEVFAKYTPVFSPGHLPQLTKDEFSSFLYFENNRHWSGLYRKGLALAADMSLLQMALGSLLDESRPLAPRFTASV